MDKRECESVCSLKVKGKHLQYKRDKTWGLIVLCLSFTCDVGGGYVGSRYSGVQRLIVACNDFLAVDKELLAVGFGHKHLEGKRGDVRVQSTNQTIKHSINQLLSIQSLPRTRFFPLGWGS